MVSSNRIHSESIIESKIPMSNSDEESRNIFFLSQVRSSTYLGVKSRTSLDEHGDLQQLQQLFFWTQSISLHQNPSLFDLDFFFCRKRHRVE